MLFLDCSWPALGCCWLLWATSWLLLATSWLVAAALGEPLAAPGQVLAAAGCPWLAPRCSWLLPGSLRWLLAAPGSFCQLLAGASNVRGAAPTPSHSPSYQEEASLEKRLVRGYPCAKSVLWPLLLT